MSSNGVFQILLFIRGFVRKKMTTLGNFWVDLTRSTLYVLLPLSFVFALVSRGSTCCCSIARWTI